VITSPPSAASVQIYALLHERRQLAAIMTMSAEKRRITTSTSVTEYVYVAVEV